MSECANAPQSKILVFAIHKSPLAARVSTALSCAGFSVAALTPYRHPVRYARKVRHHFAYHSRFGLKSIVRAIEQWSPDLLTCADDNAVRELQRLHQRVMASDHKRIAGLIELSLGPQTSFRAIRNKSDFLTLAADEGLRCPKTIVFPADRVFDPAQSSLNYPILAKADHSDGGRSVRIVRRPADLRALVWELQTPCTWRGRRCFGVMLGSEALSRFKLPLRRTISLQEYIGGRPGNRAVVCWKGKVLAGISVEAVEVTHGCGPASVVRIIDHPEMSLTCERMVRRLELSGFVGFDFVLDSADQAWLLEMNPRVTQTCHFVLADGTNLAAALRAQMTSRPTRSRPVTVYRDLVALFPNEMLRAPSGKYLKLCRHDVPWDEPELVRCILNQELRIGIGKRVRLFLEHRFPPIIEALVRIGLVGERGGYSPPISKM